MMLTLWNDASTIAGKRARTVMTSASGRRGLLSASDGIVDGVSDKYDADDCSGHGVGDQP